jgi:hypothetical protein
MTRRVASLIGKPRFRPDRTAPLLDIKWIRENQDAFLKGLTDHGFPEPGETLNRILSLDEQRRGTIQKLPQRRLQGDRPGQSQQG